MRGGVAKLDEGHRLAALWQALPEELRLSPHRYLATNSPQGPWWLLGWCERVPEADEVACAAAAVPGTDRAGGPLRAHTDVPPRS
ncbi:rhsC domain protein, partial [Escherichia coli 2-474-04_S3_C1]